jgi:hypothetical protein
LHPRKDVGGSADHDGGGFFDTLLVAATAKETSEVALKVLECVTLGRADNIQDGWESQAGIVPGQIKATTYADPQVRAYALWNIGETGVPAALQFLKGLTRSDFGVDASGRLWASAQVALSNALLNQIEDPKLKTEFLVHTMKTSIAAAWAGEELCNRGALSALPDVQSWMKRRRSGRPGQDDSEFCEARMRAVAADPDRAKALGSVFSSFMTLANGFPGRRLLTWAIGELGAMNSLEADAELDRIRDEIGAVLKGDPGESNLLQFQAQLDDTRRSRVK